MVFEPMTPTMLSFGGMISKLIMGVSVTIHGRGMSVEVVRDPMDPAHIIVVGTPQDWAPKPWVDAVSWALGLVLGLGAVGFVGAKIIPERAEPVFEKSFDATERFDIGGRLVRWVVRTLQR